MKPDLLNQRLQEIIELESAQDFWNDIENATKIGIEKNRILGKLNKFNKNISQKDMEQALKDYELGISEEKRSSIYGPAHINFLNNPSIKGIKAYLDSIQ